MCIILLIENKMINNIISKISQMLNNKLKYGKRIYK